MRIPMTTAALVVAGAAIGAQPANTFVKIEAPVVALTHVRVIDGTGAAARDNQTIVIRDGNIAELGDAARLTPPSAATVVDLTAEAFCPAS